MNKVMAVHSTFSRNWICKTNIWHLDKPYGTHTFHITYAVSETNDAHQYTCS